MKGVDTFLLIGTGTEIFARAATKAGIEVNKLYTMVGERTERIFERIIALSGSSSVVLGAGNIKGDGLLLDEFIKNRTFSHG